MKSYKFKTLIATVLSTFLVSTIHISLATDDSVDMSTKSNSKKIRIKQTVKNYSNMLKNLGKKAKDFFKLKKYKGKTKYDAIERIDTEKNTQEKVSAKVQYVNYKEYKLNRHKYDSIKEVSVKIPDNTTQSAPFGANLKYLSVPNNFIFTPNTLKACDNLSNIQLSRKFKMSQTSEPDEKTITVLDSEIFLLDIISNAFTPENYKQNGKFLTQNNRKEFYKLYNSIFPNIKSGSNDEFSKADGYSSIIEQLKEHNLKISELIQKLENWR